MRTFALMTEAYWWLVNQKATTCSVVIHGDPYLWVHREGGYILERKYPSEFYLRPYQASGIGA